MHLLKAKQNKAIISFKFWSQNSILMKIFVRSKTAVNIKTYFNVRFHIAASSFSDIQIRLEGSIDNEVTLAMLVLKTVMFHN